MAGAPFSFEHLWRALSLPLPRRKRGPDIVGRAVATGLLLYADNGSLTCFPTERHLAERLGLSRGAVHAAILRLRASGFVAMKMVDGHAVYDLRSAFAAGSPAPSSGAFPGAIPGSPVDPGEAGKSGSPADQIGSAAEPENEHAPRISCRSSPDLLQITPGSPADPDLLSIYSGTAQQDRARADEGKLRKRKTVPRSGVPSPSDSGLLRSPQIDSRVSAPPSDPANGEIPVELAQSRIVRAHRPAYLARKHRGHPTTPEELLVGWAVLYWRAFDYDDPDLVRPEARRVQIGEIGARLKEWFDGDAAEFHRFFASLFAWWPAGVRKREARRDSWPKQPSPTLNAVLASAAFWKHWKQGDFERDVEKYSDVEEVRSNGGGESDPDGRAQRAHGAGDADAAAPGRSRALDGLA